MEEMKRNINIDDKKFMVTIIKKINILYIHLLNVVCDIYNKDHIHN